MHIIDRDNFAKGLYHRCVPRLDAFHLRIIRYQFPLRILHTFPNIAFALREEESRCTHRQVNNGAELMIKPRKGNRHTRFHKQEISDQIADNQHQQARFPSAQSCGEQHGKEEQAVGIGRAEQGIEQITHIRDQERREKPEQIGSGHRPPCVDTRH